MIVYLNNTEDLYQITDDVREEANKQLAHINTLICANHRKKYFNFPQNK